jgi:N-acetylated-alpha-linked acidic dipeptidase
MRSHRWWLLAAALCLPTVRMSAQEDALPGYSAEHARAEGAAERAAIVRANPDTARELSRALSAEAHVAGSLAGARARDLVANRLQALGLPTEIRRYDVYMPFATSVRLWRVSPSPRELELAEPPVPGDSEAAGPQYPTVNGYSGAGDVTGELVYANYGLIEDYARLDSIGVSVRGRIVVARYGRTYRGIKAREAERHGAAALLLYSDPQNDGFATGDVYPAGPMRNWQGVQRGSVMNGVGDPATPGAASLPSTPRLAPERMDLPHIPVIPISYANAGELLGGLRGRDIPDAWQGGLPFRYHVGPGPVQARIQVTDDRATHGVKPIHDVFGIVRGSELPDELVIVGGHYDAWSPGTWDNVSGTVSVLEIARAVAAAVRAGHPPRRTIVFAAWDGEEWGLIGSTEYVEEDSLRLLRGAVAYLNQDAVASGPRFAAGGSPSLRALLRDATTRVADPSGRGSVYREWQRARGLIDSTAPPMTDPGGGSDFAGFYNHLGIPVVDWGFGGPSGVYHSQYDDLAWMERFGDPAFTSHAATARIGAVLALRLANADVLPYDYVEFARTIRRYLPPIERQATARGWTLSTSELGAAIDRMERAAAGFARTRDSVLARPTPSARLRAANAALLRVERALTRPSGLRTRPWYRNLVYAADEDNGYANMPLPSVNEALRAGDARLAADEVADLATRLDTATQAIVRAEAALQGR